MSKTDNWAVILAAVALILLVIFLASIALFSPITAKNVDVVVPLGGTTLRLEAEKVVFREGRVHVTTAQGSWVLPDAGVLVTPRGQVKTTAAATGSTNAPPAGVAPPPGAASSP